MYMCTFQYAIHETQQNKIQKLSLRSIFGRQFAIAYRGGIDKILTNHYEIRIMLIIVDRAEESRRARDV